MTRFLNNKKTRTAFLVLGIILLINGVIAAVLESLALGVILAIALGICLTLCSLPTNSKITMITKLVLLTLLMTFISYSAFVYIYGSNDNVTYKEDAVIVLGTVVIGDKPSTDLKNRLDATIDYCGKNPNALIIVTGGQGTEKRASEASVMAKYLIDAGIPADKIVKEDKATSTAENFEFSKRILKNIGFDNPKIAYISNDFHLYRSGVLAKNAGFEDATHYHGSTPWYMVIPNGFRETIVTIKMWIID